jgi:hypothetical protein
MTSVHASPAKNGPETIEVTDKPGPVEGGENDPFRLRDQPKPGDPSPTPSDSTTTPSDSTGTPSDSTGAPGDTIPVVD